MNTLLLMIAQLSVNERGKGKALVLFCLPHTGPGMPEKILHSLLFCIITMATMQSASASHEVDESGRSPLDNLVNQKISQYHAWYPDIYILALKGGKNTLVDMATLGGVLNARSTNVDYEHPPGLREQLLNVSLNRILTMLQAGMPSSSLFKTDALDSDEKYLCVLTINPQAVAGDSLRATSHFLDQTDEFISNIPEDRQLQSKPYLEFVIDHEFYHCLYAKLIEPQPMSKKALWGDYYHYHSELGADAYALAMHIRRQGAITGFARNLQLMRGTSLSSADVSHLTCNAIEELFKIPPETIVKLDEKEVFSLANNIREKSKLDYRQYLQFAASAVRVMEKLGIGYLVSEEFRQGLEGIIPDEAEVDRMITYNEFCLDKLSGKSSK